MPSFTQVSSPPPRCDAVAVLADVGEAREGWCRVLGGKLRFLDQTDVNLLQLVPLPELVTLVESPSAFHWGVRRADWLTQLAGSETNLMVCNGP